jgi:acylphosphatase
MGQAAGDEREAKETLRATIRGRVQAVGFRVFVRDAAERLNIGGYVRNEPDGSVYVEAHGGRADLEALLSYLRRGPSMARVERVDAEWREGRGEATGRFEVRP